MKTRIIYLICINALISINCFSQKIVWKPKSSLPVASFGGVADVIGHDIYYADDSVIYKYTIALDEWTKITDHTINGSHFAMSIIDSVLYFFGGGTNFSDTKNYSLKTNKWSTGTSMPTGRKHIKSEFVNDEIYILGGFQELFPYIKNNNEVYNSKTDTWEVKSPIPEPRENYRLSLHDSIIYMWGGTTKKGNDFFVSKTVYAYNTNNDTWDSITVMPVDREKQAVVKLNDYVIQAGGFVTGVHSKSVDIYNIKKNLWTSANPLPAVNVAMAYATHENSIYIIGGRNHNPDYTFTAYATLFVGELITDSNFEPENYLPLPDTSAIVGASFSYTIPPFTFIDDDTLSYNAKLISGENLPDWLSFNDKNLEFNGIPEKQDTLIIKITVTDNYKASTSDTIQIVIGIEHTYVKQLNSINLDIFPNPAQNTIYFNSQENLTNCTYKLSNLQGKIVKTDVIISKTIDVSDIQTGIYFIQIYVNGSNIVKKILIE